MSYGGYGPDSYTQGTYRYDRHGQPYSWQPVDPRPMRFSRQEINELAMTIAALTISFTLSRRVFADNLYELGVIAISSFIAMLTAFLLHELGHKFLAQRYGCWSEFRAWKRGLLFSLLISLIMAPFFFAAPGAVYIHGYLTKEQNGRISAMGPGVNIMVAIIASIPLLLTDVEMLFSLLYFVASVNIWLAGFNLLPIPPMDGSKIWKWDIGTYLGMWAAVIFLYMLIEGYLFAFF